MRVRSQAVIAGGIAAIFLSALPRSAGAVILCTHLNGTPSPTVNIGLAMRVILKYGNDGPGGNNDRPKVKKGGYTNPNPFNPDTSDTVHITLRDETTEAVLFTASLTGPKWVQLGNKWRYKDPAATLGIKKVVIVKMSGPNDDYLLGVIKGKSTNINGPLPQTNPLHVMLEITDQSGNGVCYGSTLSNCVTSGNGPNKQRCDF